MKDYVKQETRALFKHADSDGPSPWKRKRLIRRARHIAKRLLQRTPAPPDDTKETPDA